VDTAARGVVDGWEAVGAVIELERRIFADLASEKCAPALNRARA